MELPATIYIAIGAVIAAFITGGISFINLVISKDQKVSEFRQNWIDELRKDIAEFIGHTSKYSAFFSWTYKRYKTDTEKIEETKKVFEKDLEVTAALFNRIWLRLNPKDDKNILDKLKEIENCYEGPFINLADTSKTSKLTSELRDMVQVLLKKEWKRVKRGELTFQITKYSALILFFSMIFILMLYYKEILKIFIQ